MKKYTFDEVKMSHEGMLRAKERLIARAQAAASRQGLIGKAEFAAFVAALFLYEIWFSLVVYAHLTIKRIASDKRLPKVAVIVLAVLVFTGIAAFASGSKNASRTSDKGNSGVEKGTINQNEDETSVDGSLIVEEKSEASVDSVEESASDDSEEPGDSTNADSSDEETSADPSDEESAEDADDSSLEELAGGPDNYADLKKKNSDYYGWITSEDAGIDSAVMYAKPRQEKYLDKDFYGKYNKNGLPSVVDEVRGDLSSIIIYAGNTDGNGEFSGLLKYQNEECLGTVKLDTPDESIEFEIITGFAESEEAKDNEALLHIGDNAKSGDVFLVLVTGTEGGRRFYVVAKSI